MGSITSTDLPENFSFNCYELDSTFETIFNDDNESYYEISLEPKPDSKEIDFRVSFSTVPLNEFSGQIFSNQLFDQGHILASQGRNMISSASDTETQITSGRRSAAEGTMRISTAEISSCREVFQVVNRRVKFCETVNDGVRERSAENRELIGGSRYNLKVDPTLSGMKFGRQPIILSSLNLIRRTDLIVMAAWNYSMQMRESTIHAAVNTVDSLISMAAWDHFSLIRKPSKMVTAFNSGIMKFFIKIRSGNILSTFMSLIRSYHSLSNQSKGRTQETIRIYGRLTNPFNRWWPQINNISNRKRRNSNSRNNNNDVNLSIKFKETEVKSSPSWKNSSPARRDLLDGRMSSSERENSVRAAIDHCKRST